MICVRMLVIQVLIKWFFCLRGDCFKIRGLKFRERKIEIYKEREKESG